MGQRKHHPVGTRFGRLTIISAETKRLANPKEIAWLCRCDCGFEGYFKAKSLNQDRVKSCGCLRSDMAKVRVQSIKGPKKYRISMNATPGRARTYRSWEKMKARCHNENDIHYKYYGARGIKICAEWINAFEAFFDYMGERPEGLSIGRIDNDKDYEPSNCRWETPAQQANNKGLYRKKVKPLKDLGTYYRRRTEDETGWQILCDAEGAPVFTRTNASEALRIVRLINRRSGDDREVYIKFLQSIPA